MKYLYLHRPGVHGGQKRQKGAPPAGEGDEGEGHSELPPQANGKGKGLENGKGPPPAGGDEESGEVSPSGGLSSGTPATGEGD